MSQPFNQQATCPASGELDTELGEFWLENPWQPTEHNLSAYERNRVLLNTSHGWFADLSHASGGADIDSDSRSVVAGDFDEDGMLDLLVRSSGGGPIRLFRNKAPKANYVRLSLRGTESHARGIGTQIRAKVGELVLHRTMQAPNGFLGQSPSEIHLGLGTAEQIETLEVLWTSGKKQSISTLEANQHWVIHENRNKPEKFLNQ